MTDYTVPSNVSSSGITVSSGDTWNIYGSATGFKVDGSGNENVLSGGTTTGTVVFNGGAQTESSGGIGSFTTVSNGGTEQVSSGGSAAFATVSGGGFQYVFSGGTSIDTDLSYNGSPVTTNQSNYGDGEIVYGGTASGTDVRYLGALTVEFGGSAVDTTVSALGSAGVYGGTTSFTTVSAGGVEVVSLGGTTSFTTVSGDGTEEVGGGGIAFPTPFAGGSAVATTVAGSGGSEFVFSGGTAIDTTVDTGAFLIVLPGGVQTDTMLSGGEIVSTGIVFYSQNSGVTLGGSATSGAVLDGVEKNYVLPGGVVSLTTTATDYEDVLPGGTATDTTIDGHGRLTVFSGGTAVGATVRDFGYEIVSGGTATSTTLSSFGYELVYGGSAVSVSISNGGRETELGGTTSFTLISSGGEEDLGGGSAVSTTVFSGGAEVVFAGTAIATTVSNGGNQYVYSAAETSLTVVKSGGFEVVSNGGSAIDTVVSSGGFEVISAGASATDTTVELGGSIDLTTVQYVAGAVSATVDASDVLSVTSAGTVVYEQQLVGDYSGVAFKTSLDPLDGFSTLVTAEAMSCYCRGTRMLTDRGEVAVENLRTGDMVATRRNGGTTFRPITWLGRSGVDVAACGNARDAYPVRVRAHAFGDGVPTRDLLVTSEHCIFVDGVLIPVRMLVNGRSIVVDTRITRYEYFHVELEHHAILVAEGLEAESYLDTGNRGNFANAPAPSLRPDFSLAPAHKGWEQDAAAPLAVDAPTVEPIWLRLAARAVSLDEGTQIAETTEDADLCIEVKGQVRRPIHQANGRAVFVLPKGAADVQILSRSAVPADSRPWLNDRRRLGVNVRQIVLRDAQVMLDIPLDDPGLGRGWWGIEGADVARHRWTDGAAMLALPAPRQSMGLLEVQLASGMTYVTGENHRAA